MKIIMHKHLQTMLLKNGLATPYQALRQWPFVNTTDDCHPGTRSSDCMIYVGLWIYIRKRICTELMSALCYREILSCYDIIHIKSNLFKETLEIPCTYLITFQWSCWHCWRIVAFEFLPCTRGRNLRWTSLNLLNEGIDVWILEKPNCLRITFNRVALLHHNERIQLPVTMS